MRPTTLLSLLAPLLPLTAARITSIAVPTTLSPGANFTLQIKGTNYIQQVEEISIAYGYASVARAYPKTLGDELLGSYYLGPAQSNTVGTIEVPVSFPEGVEMGEGYFAAALTSLYGVLRGPTVAYFNVSVVVGDAVSAEVGESAAWTIVS